MIFKARKTLSKKSGKAKRRYPLSNELISHRESKDWRRKANTSYGQRVLLNANYNVWENLCGGK